MRAEDVLRFVIDDSGKSMYAISLGMGKSKLYIAQAIYNNRIPTLRTFAEICEVTGHELIVRNKETGFETVIDPPERSDTGDSGTAVSI